MRAQQQNRDKMKTLAASASQQGSSSAAAVVRETSGESQSTQQNDPAARPAGRPLGKIAHDFNNILTLVLGYGENLLKTLPKAHPGHAYAEEICRAAREGEQLSLELSSLAHSTRAENSASAER